MSVKHFQYVVEYIAQVFINLCEKEGRSVFSCFAEDTKFRWIHDLKHTDTNRILSTHLHIKCDITNPKLLYNLFFIAPNIHTLASIRKPRWCLWLRMDRASSSTSSSSWLGFQFAPPKALRVPREPCPSLQDIFIAINSTRLGWYHEQ